MRINTERLRDDLLTNGSYGSVGASDGHGRTVLTGSEADKKARTRLVDVLESIGLDVRIDPVGNIAGRWVPDGADPDADAVAVGSHLDSVIEGGIFDGPLGVYGGVEAVRAMQESGYEPNRPIDIVCFTEEEGGRFSVGLLGSSVAGGHRSPEEALAFEDGAGTTLETYLDRIGFHGSDRISPEQWDAWFELHIEQGTVLENEDIPVGIVTAITGITNCHVEIVGNADHAGSTLMKGRTDALIGASEFIQDVKRIARETVAVQSEFAVATVGKIDVEPGARNVIPGKVELSIDIRDVDPAVMDEIVQQAQRSLARIEDEQGLSGDLDRYRTENPTRMSERCQTALQTATDRREIESMQLPSGGGHDTMNLAHETDVGLLFAPSENGISHSPQEWTEWEDCAEATQVLADAIADVTNANPTA